MKSDRSAEGHGAREKIHKLESSTCCWTALRPGCQVERAPPETVPGNCCGQGGGGPRWKAKGLLCLDFSANRPHNSIGRWDLDPKPFAPRTACDAGHWARTGTGGTAGPCAALRRPLRAQCAKIGMDVGLAALQSCVWTAKRTADDLWRKAVNRRVA